MQHSGFIQKQQLASIKIYPFSAASVSFGGSFIDETHHEFDTNDGSSFQTLTHSENSYSNSILMYLVFQMHKTATVIMWCWIFHLQIG